MLPVVNELKTDKTSEESQRKRKSRAYNTRFLAYVTLLSKNSSCGAAVLVRAYAKHAFMQYPLITSDYLMHLKNVGLQ